MQRTGGSLRILQAFFWLRVFSTSQAESTPAHPPLTQTVRAEPKRFLVLCGSLNPSGLRFWLAELAHISWHILGSRGSALCQPCLKRPLRGFFLAKSGFRYAVLSNIACRRTGLSPFQTAALCQISRHHNWLVLPGPPRR